MAIRTRRVAVGLLLVCFWFWLIASRREEKLTLQLQGPPVASMGHLRTQGDAIQVESGLRRLVSADYPGPVGQVQVGATVPLDRIESLIATQRGMIQAASHLQGNAAKLALSKVEFFRDRDVDDLLSEFPAQNRVELEARLRTAIPIPLVPEERIIILPPGS